MNKVLLVGQTPPPYGGQAVMIEEIRKTFLNEPKVIFVRMAFSEEMDSAGKFQLKKIYILISLLIKILKIRFVEKVNVLYYPPAGGAGKVALYRDFIILGIARLLFKKNIFHFHAGGIAEFYSQLNRIEKKLYHFSYFSPDLSIVMSPRGEKDPIFLNSKNIDIIPYGIEDEYLKSFLSLKREYNIVPKVLFVGVIRESKGIMNLLMSCKILKDRNILFELNIVGKYESEEFQNCVENFISKNELNDDIKIHGVKNGYEKFELFFLSDIFCFPSHFESENFPVVIIEAMMFSLPVVATDWRGISDLVIQNETGFLHPIKDCISTANSLETLINNPELRIEMGKKGRAIFEEKYTLEIFRKSIIETFETL